MGIEKDINQNKFSNERQKAMINILFTYGWITEQVRSYLSSEDITLQQFNILRILRGSFPKPLSTLQIRERMLDKMSDTSRIVDRLIAKGLVKKTVSAKDKRLVDVLITEKGQELLNKLNIETNKIDDIMGSLSTEEANSLSALLDKLRERTLN